jgi:hypothetical protein
MSDSINSIVSFTPANIVAVGKNSSEKRMSIATQAGTVSTMYIAAGKGKAAVQARDNLGRGSVTLMAGACANGNYMPLAEALAFTMGESVSVLRLADLDSLVWSITHRISNLKDAGYSSKTGKATATLTALTNAKALAENVTAASAEIIAKRVEARNQARIAVATAQESSVTA